MRQLNLRPPIQLPPGKSDIQYICRYILFSSFFKYNFHFFIQDLFYISDNLEKRCSLAGPYIKYGVIT